MRTQDSLSIRQALSRCASFSRNRRENSRSDQVLRPLATRAQGQTKSTCMQRILLAVSKRLWPSPVESQTKRTLWAHVPSMAGSKIQTRPSCSRVSENQTQWRQEGLAPPRLWLCKTTTTTSTTRGSSMLGEALLARVLSLRRTSKRTAT